MAEAKIGILIEAKDNASRTLREVGNSVDHVNERSKRLAPSLKQMAAVGAVAFTALAVAVGGVIKATAAFESRLGDISTLISGDSTEAINGLRTGILELTKTIPKTADDLGASAYAIFSAGITDSAQALDVLKNSAKLATAGLGTTEEATTLMTLAINNFRDSGLDASQISDILFKTVKNGITTVSDLSQSFGLVAPLAVAAGISLQELSAMTAALTQVNKSASISQNSLKAALVSLSKPTKDAQDLFGKLGVVTFKELIAKTGGATSAFQAMQDASEGNTSQFAGAIGSGEALTSVLALLSTQAGVVASSYADMTTGANAVEEAFGKQTAQFEKQWQLLKNNLNVEIQKLGIILLPAVTDALTKLNELGLSGVIDKFRNLGALISESIQQLDMHTGLITMMKEAWDNVVLVFTQNLLPALRELWAAIEPLQPFLQALAQVAGGMLVIAFGALVKVIEYTAILLVQIITTGTQVATFFTNVFVKSINFVIETLSSLSNWIEKVISAFARLNIAQGIRNVGSNISSGFSSFVGKINPFAEGGIVTRPTLAMIGEGGESEAVIPLSKLKNFGGGGSTVVNITGGNYLSADAGRLFGNEIVEALRRNMKI